MLDLTKRYILQLSKPEQHQITQIMKECARLWNDLIKTNEWTSAPDLQKMFQGGKYNIHSDTLTALCQRIVANRKTARRNNTNLPYKIKSEVTITGKKRQFLKGNVLSLSKSVQIKLSDEVNMKDSNFFHIVKRKGNFYLFCTESIETPSVSESDVIAAVDLGEIHSIASVDSKGRQRIYSGREIRSKKRYRNKTFKALSKKMSKCKKDSRRHKKLQAAKDRVSKDIKNQTRDIFHHVTKEFVKDCVSDGVGMVVVGDPGGVGQDTKKEGRVKTKKGRQKLSQFECGTLKSLLEYKCALSGIRFKKVEESWTTQTCPACDHRNEVKGRNYKCSECDFKCHRDIVGGFNIHRKERFLDVGVLSGKRIIFKRSVKKKKKVSDAFIGVSSSSGLEPASIMTLT